MRGKARQIWHGAALCVPGCVIVCLTVLALWYFVPRCEVQEAAEWEGKCAAVAAELKAGEGARDYVGMVPAAWIEGKSVRGKRGEVEGAEWGHFARSEEEEFVWCRAGDFLVGRFVEGFCLSGFVWWMCGLGGVMMGLAVVLSVMLVRAFVGADQERIDFMRMVAHDLASPLVGIRMLVGKDDETVRNLNEQALGMVENFRAFAQMSTRSVPKFGKVDVRKVYEGAYKIFREDYRDYFGGEDVEVTAEAGAAYVAWADEMMVGQILWNLLGNDLKYAAPYGKVRVEFECAADFVVVRFVDDGPGMTAREMRRAFGRYYRGRSAAAGRASGYGIGLATGRAAARAMGGDLDVRGNVPRGCIFELRLPKAKED